MRKIVFSMGCAMLFLTTFGMFHPQTVEAAEGGPAGKFMLQATSGPNAGQVTLTWIDAGSADNYDLVYGTDPKNLQYGVLNIGTNNVYTVGMLNSGMKYYFALVPVMHNMAMYTSEWVSAWPMGGDQMAAVEVSTPSTQSMVQPATPMVSAPPTSMGPVGQQWLVAMSGPNEGEVTLNWRHAENANNYDLVYSTQPGKYLYGAVNIGWITSFTVRSLVPGTTYYFALVPVKNDTGLYTTSPVAGVAKMNVEVVQTTADAVIQPPVQPIVEPVMNVTPTIEVIPSTDSAVPTTAAGY